MTEKGPDFELIFKTFVPKCVCLRGSAPDPAGGPYSAPRPPAGKGWVTHKSVPLTFLSGSTPLICDTRRYAKTLTSTIYDSSRKVPVLAHFTIHMVEFIQLYTNQPHTWLGFRHHPSSSVFQPYIWLGTISNSLNF